MRTLFSSLVAAGLLTSQIATAACVSPSDREALDVAGLKTALMVQTLTCKNDTQYNAFITKFKPELTADEKVASGYFSRTYGRASQKRHDEFMTQLANSKADASQRDGSRYCAHNEETFSEVMALQNGSELKQYAAGRAIAMPTVLTSCNAAEPATRATTRATTRHTTKSRSRS